MSVLLTGPASPPSCRTRAASPSNSMLPSAQGTMPPLLPRRPRGKQGEVNRLYFQYVMACHFPWVTGLRRDNSVERERGRTIVKVVSPVAVTRAPGKEQCSPPRASLGAQLTIVPLLCSRGSSPHH